MCGHDVSIPSPNSLSLSNSDAKRTNSHRLNGNNNAELRLQIHCVYAQAYICSTCSTIYLHLIVCQLPMFDLCALYRSRCIYLYLLSVYQPGCLPAWLLACWCWLSIGVRACVCFCAERAHQSSFTQSTVMSFDNLILLFDCMQCAYFSM